MPAAPTAWLALLTKIFPDTIPADAEPPRKSAGRAASPSAAIRSDFLILILSFAPEDPVRCGAEPTADRRAAGRFLRVPPFNRSLRFPWLRRSRPQGG